jgi:hypothetical protein
MQYVRRRKGEELLPECTLKTVKHPEYVMVWGSMSAGGIGRFTLSTAWLMPTIASQKF